MKKILIFHPYLAPYRIDLYNRLSESFNVKVILTGSEKELKTLGFDLKYVNRQANFDYKYFNSGFYLGRHLFSLVYLREIKKFKPNIVLAHELGINTLLSILGSFFFSYNLWVTIDDSPTMLQNIGGFRKKMLNKVVKSVDKMLVVHPVVEKILREMYGNEISKFNYFPIIQDDTKLIKKFEDASIEASDLIKEYQLESRQVVLFVGRLESVKCPNLLLEAFKKLNEQNTVLVFIGNGSLFDLLKEDVVNSKLEERVLFRGRLTGKELYAWYKIANVFVLPSKFEPFGAVVNEALVAGCYVLVSDRVGANSLVDESNGYIFKSGDLKDLIFGLSTLLKIKKNNNMNKMNISFNDYVKVFDNYFTRV
ncbi:glycosyltransferase family 4 protein [Polaribacter sp. R77954]|uniref:glycosyltransferase family 4 protein n=1 Tax=Polaribacter sp. R77954 TaxID=3093870 RepID=UPI0037CB63C3